MKSDFDRHPLELLTADEIDTARIVLDSAGLVGPDVRFAYLGLEEPSKQELYGMADAASIDRRVRTFLLNVRTVVSIDALVNLTRSTVERRRIIDVVAEGQVPVLLEEFDSIEEILALDEGWCASLRARGLTPDDVKVAPLSAGVFDFPDEAGKRLLRGVPFLETARGRSCLGAPDRQSGCLHRHDRVPRRSTHRPRRRACPGRIR